MSTGKSIELGEATDVLVDAGIPPSVRARAADSVLNHSVKAAEVEDIQVRLSALERAAESVERSAHAGAGSDECAI
jgi:hypothetical protein